MLSEPFVEFFTAGLAIPQPRAGPGKGGHMIMSKASHAIRGWRQTLKLMAQQAMLGRVMLSKCPVRLVVQFLFPRPKRLGEENDLTALLHIQDPDLDNIWKAVSDAFKMVVWQDDCLVSTAHVRKRFAKTSEKPGVIVRVYRDYVMSP